MSCRLLVRFCSLNLGQKLNSRTTICSAIYPKWCPVIAGAFFMPHRSDLWSRSATRNVTQSLPRQIMPSEYRKCAEKSQKNLPEEPQKPAKEGLVARFKKMYKEYWYVLVPVHIVTSAGWLGGFYYLSKSGVDIATILETWRFNETIISHLRDSHLGHLAIAYFLYKIFTPLRYMVTLGGTTVSIKYLSKWGYIKPVPSKNQLMKMYQDKKAAKIQAKEDKLKSEE